MILDTSFIIDLLDGDEAAINRAEALAADSPVERLSAVTVFELYHGIWRRDYSDAERERVVDVLETKPVVAANAEVMRAAGRIHGQLENDGRPIGVLDTIIAATALSINEPVVTKNVDHFERIDGVSVESY